MSARTVSPESLVMREAASAPELACRENIVLGQRAVAFRAKAVDTATMVLVRACSARQVPTAMTPRARLFALLAPQDCTPVQVEL